MDNIIRSGSHHARDQVADGETGGFFVVLLNGIRTVGSEHGHKAAEFFCRLYSGVKLPVGQSIIILIAVLPVEIKLNILVLADLKWID